MQRFLCAAAVAALLAASPATAQEKTKIDFWYGLSGQLSKVIQTFCSNFNASQPDYELVCTSQGDYDTALQNAIAAYRSNKQPAILQVFEIGTATMMLSGAVYPAYQLMQDQGEKVDWNDYVTSIKNYYADSKGNLWSFPFNSSTFVLYVNTTMFEKAGIKDMPDTWQQLEADMRKMKAAGIKCTHAYEISPANQWEQTHTIHNVALATNNNGFDGLDTKLLYDKSVFRNHVVMLKRWLDEGLATYYRPKSGLSSREAFGHAECATYAGSIAGYGATLEEMPKDQSWKVIPLPIHEGFTRHNTSVGGASLWTFKGFDAKTYKGVAAFYTWLGKPEQQKAFSEATGYIPTTNSGYQLMLDSGSYSGPRESMRVAMESLRYGEATPLTRGMRLGNMAQLRQIVTDELEKIFAGTVSVDDGLASGVRRSNEVLARFAQGYAGKQLP